MPSSKNGGNIEFGVSFKTDSSLDKLKKSLQDLQKVKLGDFKGSANELDRVKETAQKVESILGRAFNPTLNTTNISTFNNELKKSNLTIEQIKSDFSQFGKEGQLAFSRMASSLLTTNLKLKQTNSLIDSMGKTMVNTVKWGIASSVMNTFTQSVQGAFQYVQSLEKSLTNIRIVTGDSTEKMAQFAEQANRSAQALGRSTLDYTKASLTYYQQGLNDEDVQARTEATLKAQNITGAGSQMADYLTSVWNGYKVANEEAELYVDKLAAVADSSASDMSQLAIAMSKVASTANTMGVDIDQLNAQIATVVATTRQAPESVGTAFKTIYARMNDIKTGSDEAEISLGRYSGTMASLGFNVLDATGHLRDTGQVMEEIGGRWQELTKEQQIYLAQTMGGQRQVNQLMALFDNWTTYSDLLNTSLESEGTLAEKNARYMESLGAKMEKLGAAGERVKDSLIDTDSMKGIVDILTNVTNLVATLFESIGGGNNVLLAFGSIATQVFGGTISKEIAHMIEGFQNAKANAEILKNDIALTKTFENSQGENTKGLQFVQENMGKLQKYYSILDESAINEQKNIIDRIGVLKDEQTQLQQNQNAVREYAERIGEVEESQAAFNDSQNFSNTNMALGTLVDNARVLKQQYDILKSSGFTNNEELEKFKTQFQELLDDSEKLGISVDKVRQAFNSGNWAEIGVSKIFDEAIQKGELFSTTINKSGNALEDTTNKINNLTSVMQSKQNSFETLFNVNNAIKFASTVGQIGSIMTSITNLGNIIKNEDLSASEKLSKTLTNIGFLLPMIINTSKNISSLLGITNALTQRRLILEQKISKEKDRQALLDKKAEIAEKAKVLQAQLKSGKGDTNKIFQEAKNLKNQDLALNEQLKNLDKQIINITDKVKDLPGTISTAFGAASSSITSFIGILGSIAVPLLAITAVVTTGYAIYKAYNQASDAAKEAAKNARLAKEEYDKVKESFKDLTSSIEDYADAKNALSELTSGTEQWYNKINELNDKVLQLLQKFPELAEYITTTEDGLLQISDNGLEKVKNTYRQRAYAAGMANANLQEKSYQAGRNADVTEEGRRIYGTFGMFGGKDTMEAVLSAVQKKGTGILGDEKALRAALADENVDLNQDQIDATMRNTQQIIKLSSSLEAEKTQVDALRDSLVKTNLINEEAYRNSQNKEAFADIVSKAIDQERGNGLKQFEKQQMDMYGNVTKYLDPKAIIEKYEELSGNEVQQKGNKISTRQAGSDEEFKETSFAEIKAYVEEASVDMEKILADATERMAAAQQNFANVSDRVKEVLFNSGLTEGFDKVNAKQFSQEDVKNLQGLNQSDLANYLGIPQKDLRDGLKSLGEAVKQETDNFIQGIENIRVKDALTKIQNENQDLSEELAEFIAQQIQDGFNVKDFVGEGQNQKVIGTAISDFYKSISNDELEEATKVAENFDFATGSTQDFIKALQTAGVTSSEISQDVVNNFIEAKRKIQNVQASDNRVDPTKVANGSSTIGLAQKQANGENLSNKEIESLKTGLEDLLQVYPKLTKQIQTLKEVGLAGTASYQQALRKLKMALVESYQDMAAAGTISLEQIGQQMSSYITTSEDLQMVQNAGIFTFQDYAQKLKILANNYDSCKNELQEYTLALQSNDVAAAATAQFGLELALRSAENAEKYGVEAERISDLANKYIELANQGVQAYEGLNRNAELAADAATRYIRLNDSIENLQKNFTAVSEVLNTLSTHGLEEVLGDADYAKTFEQIKESVAGILNVSQELVDADFIKEYSQQIKEAAQGSQEAVDALQDAFAEDIIANIKIDDQEFYNTLGQTKEQFANWLNDLPEGEINLDENPAIQSLVTLLEQAGYSKEQIEDLFSGANIDLDLGYPDISEVEQAAEDLYEVGQTGGANLSNGMAETGGVDVVENAETSEQPDNIEAAGVEATLEPQEADVSFPRVAAMAIPGVGYLPQIDGTTPGHITYYGVSVKPKVEEEQATKTNTAVGLEVKGANKSSGGKVSHRNKSGGNKKGGSGGGKGKKGGGGGKGSQPKQPNKAKGVTKEADRYHNNTVKSNKLAKSLDKLNKQQDRLHGKDSLKNLEKQLKLIEKQKDNIQERLNLEKDQQNELKASLALYGAQFNKDGTIKNYESTFNKIIGTYNKAVAKWNKMSAEEQEKNKDFLENQKQQMDKALSNLDRYDKVLDELADYRQKLIDKAQEQIDIKVKEFDIKVQAKLDFAEARRDWNEFKKEIQYDVRDDDFLGQNNWAFQDLTSYYNNQGTGTVQFFSNQLQDLVTEGQRLFSQTYYNVYGQAQTVTDRAAYLEKLKETSQNLKQQMQGWRQTVDKIKESIFDAIDAAQDAFDQQMREYEYIGDIVNHNMKVTQMLFGDEAYAQMDKFYDRIEKNNNQQLNFLTQQKDMWYSRMMEQEARMQQLARINGANSNVYKEARDRFEEYKKHWMDSVKDLNSTVEDALDNIMDKYNNSINQILVNFDLKLGNGKALEDIQDEWDAINEKTDTFLDKINSAYEIDKLRNAFQDAIDDNDGNIAAQKSLNGLMEQQLAYLKDKEKLTQYDVDRANTLLQIEIKRLALEQTRANKNRLRLRRDSQGNYTYQYTANQEEVNKSQQELADLQNSLYNSDKAAYVDNLNAIKKSADNIKQQLEDIWTDENLSKQEKLQKSYELEERYGTLMNDLLAENTSIRNNLIQSSLDELVKLYGYSEEQLNAMSSEEKNKLMKDLVPQAGSLLSGSVQAMITQGGIGDYMTQVINKFLEAQDQKVKDIAELEESGQINFKDIINDQNVVLQQAEKLLDDNEKLINSYDNEIAKIQGTINAVNKMDEAYKNFFNTVQQGEKYSPLGAITEAFYTEQKEDIKTNGGTWTDIQNQYLEGKEGYENAIKTSENSYNDLVNYKPYQSQWSGSSAAAMFGSTSVPQDYLNKVKGSYQNLLNQNNTLNEKSSVLTTPTVTTDFTKPLVVSGTAILENLIKTTNSKIDAINENLTSMIKQDGNYQNKMLSTTETIKNLINQSISIAADFPNAKDVKTIIDAIESLSNIAAQKATTNNKI